MSNFTKIGWLALVGAVVVLGSSCSTIRRVPFVEAEYAAYGGAGTGTVMGQLVVTWEGAVYEGGGATVQLVPVTDYTKEMIDVELGRGLLLVPPYDGRFKKYLREVTADHHGNFVFQQVPAGEYFVIGEVGWQNPSDEDAQFEWACERITVGKGQTVQIKVTHNPNHGGVTLGTWRLE